MDQTTTEEKTQKSIEVFCCYAREDQALLSKLQRYLRPLEREGLLTLRTDTDFDAGAEWEKELHNYLATARIILLLISLDFIASEYCFGVEMEKAVKRHNEGEANVIPIILRPAPWKEPPLNKLQALPKDAKPITQWPDQDDAFNDVITGIRKAIKTIRRQDEEKQKALEAEPSSPRTSEPPLSPLPAPTTVQPTHGKTILIGILLILIIISGVLLSTSIVHQISQDNALATAQAGNFYAGTNLISDPMSGPGSAFDWKVGSLADSQCNFKNNTYAVSGVCEAQGIDEKYSIPSRFVFEINMAVGRGCGGFELFFLQGGLKQQGGIIDVSVCQNGLYDLNDTLENADSNGKTPALFTGIAQVNTVALVDEGTHVMLSINHVDVASISTTYTHPYSLYLDGSDTNGGKAEVDYMNANLWSL